jgi:hypothetical protein
VVKLNIDVSESGTVFPFSTAELRSGIQRSRESSYVMLKTKAARSFKTSV